jgi:hypothetical protein
MSCDNFQHRFPQEGTRQLYRGLVNNGGKESRLQQVNHQRHRDHDSIPSIKHERERMRVLEILGLVPPKNAKRNLNGTCTSSKKRPVDRPSYHLGSNARRRKIRSQAPFKTKSSARQQVYQVQQTTKRKLRQGNKIENQLEQKTKITLTKLTQSTPAKNKEYIWHPVQIGGKGTRSVMKFYHNQYHKQSASSLHNR